MQSNTRENLILNMRIISTIGLLLITTICLSQREKKHITISRLNSQCIIDENNLELIPSRQYSYIWTAYDTAGEYFVVTDFNSKRGIYRLGEKEIVPCVYDDIKMFRNHGFVKKGKNWAVLSGDFQKLSEFIFEDVSHFNTQGISLVKQNSHWILIDTNGNKVKTLPYDEVFQFNEDDAYKKAGSNKKYGFIDRNYNIVIPLEYDDVGIAVNNVNDVFPVKKAGKWGYVNSQNEVIVPFKYASISPIYKGFGWIRDSNFRTVGLVNAKGTILFEDGRYRQVEYANEGKLIYTAKSNVTGKFLQGYLDSASFQVLIEPQFEQCENFYNGKAIVRKNGLSAIIDNTGNILIPYNYEFIGRWGDNYVVTLKGKAGMIDKRGKVIAPLEYENCAYGGSYAIITKDGLKGILHISGKILLVPRYDHIQDISENVFYAIKGNNKYLVNLKGEETKIE